MKRKILVALTSAFVAFFSMAEAQQTAKTPRIGFVYSTGTPETPSLHSTLFEAFRPLHSTRSHLDL